MSKSEDFFTKFKAGEALRLPYLLEEILEQLQEKVGCEAGCILLLEDDEKELVLKYLVKQQIKDINEVGGVIAEYYTNKDSIMRYVKANKSFFKKDKS